jgi:hypothetical protein
VAVSVADTPVVLEAVAVVAVVLVYLMPVVIAPE